MSITGQQRHGCDAEKLVRETSLVTFTSISSFKSPNSSVKCSKLSIFDHGLSQIVRNNLILQEI